MVYQPFYYSPSATPVSTPCRMSFIPRPRLVPKSYALDESPPSEPTIFVGSNQFHGLLSLPPRPKERKAAEAEAQRLEAEEVLKANGGKPDEAEKERIAITDLCHALNVELKEVSGRLHAQCESCLLTVHYRRRSRPMATGTLQACVSLANNSHFNSPLLQPVRCRCRPTEPSWPKWHNAQLSRYTQGGGCVYEESS